MIIIRIIIIITFFLTLRKLKVDVIHTHSAANHRVTGTKIVNIMKVSHLVKVQTAPHK